MIDSGTQPDLEASETADGIRVRISASLEGAGVRADVATVLRETVFGNAEAFAATPTALERLLQLPEAAS
jgi:hypothetical protein